MGEFNEQDINYLRQELNAGNNNILIKNAVDFRAVVQVCKERGLGHWVKKDFIPHCYWNTSGNEFHLKFFDWLA